MKNQDPNQAQNQDPAARIRRQHSAEEKVRLLRLHLVEGQAISTLCDTPQIHPTLFYQWPKTFFENGAAAFDRSPRSRKVDPGTAKIEHLEARLRKKDEVIAAVTEELVRTKKELGED
jgi:transposase